MKADYSRYIKSPSCQIQKHRPLTLHVYFVEYKKTMNEGCDWLEWYNTGHKVYCHNYSVNYMVLFRYSDTGNVLHCFSFSKHFIINKRHSFGLFSSLFFIFVGACIKTIHAACQI